MYNDRPGAHLVSFAHKDVSPVSDAKSSFEVPNTFGLHGFPGTTIPSVHYTKILGRL